MSRCKAVEIFAPIHFKPTTTWSQISDLVPNILLRFRATHSIELTVFKWKIISNQNKSKTIPYTTHIYLCIIIVGFIYTLRIGQIRTCLQAPHALTGIQICIAGAIFIPVTQTLPLVDYNYNSCKNKDSPLNSARTFVDICLCAKTPKRS